MCVGTERNAELWTGGRSASKSPRSEKPPCNRPGACQIQNRISKFDRIWDAISRPLNFEFRLIIYSRKAGLAHLSSNPLCSNSKGLFDGECSTTLPHEDSFIRTLISNELGGQSQRSIYSTGQAFEVFGFSMVLRQR